MSGNTFMTSALQGNLPEENMERNQERQLNQAAFRRLSASIKQTYPPGRFLAIAGGQIIADADRFGSLRSDLETQGQDPTRVLIVQAGVAYPETGTIFAQERQV
jgi:hypothetical protein